MKKSEYIIPSIDIYHIQLSPMMANTLGTGDDDDERGPQGIIINPFDDGEEDDVFQWKVFDDENDTRRDNEGFFWNGTRHKSLL